MIDRRNTAARQRLQEALLRLAAIEMQNFRPRAHGAAPSAEKPSHPVELPGVRAGLPAETGATASADRAAENTEE